jgi:SAM-dependent methyltransferase
MRATWDALAGDPDAYVGDPARGEVELRSLFGRLGADPRGGVCVEVGCGPGRMTAALARRFDRVLAVDVSPAMLALARENVHADNVEFGEVPGDTLRGIDDGVADVLVCYLVLQHLPTRAVVLSYLDEFARVLTTTGEAYLQLPILRGSARARAWRAVGRAIVPLTSFRGPTSTAAFRGFRLTRRELDSGLERAALRVIAADTGPHAPYRFAQDVFLRLVRA